MGTAREKAVDRARKVFALGVSTTFPGEKEACLQRLVVLFQQHNLVLYDLNSQFPKRLDLTLLRVKIGLAPAATGAAGGQKAGQQAGQKTGTKGQTGTQAGANRQGSSGSSGHQKQGKAGAGWSDSGAANTDPEVLLFRRMAAAERKRWLHGPLFSQGLMHVVKKTSAHARLLAEVRSLDKSNLGLGLEDQELVRWLEKVLSRQGSRVKCRHGSQTLFDDIAAYCRFEYLADTQQQREAAQRKKAQEEAQAREREAAERRRREEEARQAQERRDAEARRRKEEEARQAAEAQPDPTLYDFEVAFDELAEARLYLKVARRFAGDLGKVSSVSRAAEFVVKFTGTDALAAKIDGVFAQALHDLQQAAERIRAEAARTRDEAVRRAEADYAEQCEQALQVAVEQYRA